MIGYGPEDNHFVVELTYNYGIGNYKYTKDFLGMTINSKKAVANVKRSCVQFESRNGGDQLLVHSPDGYPFYLNDQDVEEGKGTWTRIQKAFVYCELHCLFFQTQSRK